MKRAALTLFLVVAVSALTSCSEQSRHEWSNFAMPDPGTEQAQTIFDFWRWSWVALLCVGVLVWGLIFWSVWVYRRRRDDEIPVQTRYNLPLEIFYTLAPVILIVPFFVHTVKIQDEVTTLSANPDHVIDVTGQQWSWTFNYTDEPVADGKNVYEVGTGSYIPTLVLPVDRTVRFRLHSPDVIHSFWITGFLYKEDVIPGRVNELEVTPNVEGDYAGKCAELCGTSHARMLFKVRVVSLDEYEAYLQTLIDKGNVSDEPLLGQDYTRTQAGLGDTEGAHE